MCEASGYGTADCEGGMLDLEAQRESLTQELHRLDREIRRITQEKACLEESLENAGNRDENSATLYEQNLERIVRRRTLLVNRRRSLFAEIMRLWHAIWDLRHLQDAFDENTGRRVRNGTREY